MPTVLVESLEWHTCEGVERPIGMQYEVDASLVDTLVAQRKAKPVESDRPAGVPPAPVLTPTS